MPGGQPADAVAVLRVHADDHEPVQPPAVRRQHSHGPVSGVHVPDRRLHDVVQRGLQLAARRRRPEGGGQHRGDAAVAVSGGGDHGVGRGHGPTVGVLAGIGKRSRSRGSGTRSVIGGPQAPRASRRVGRPGDRLAEQGLSPRADDDQVGAAGGGGERLEDRPVEDGGPGAPVHAGLRDRPEHLRLQPVVGGQVGAERARGRTPRADRRPGRRGRCTATTVASRRAASRSAQTSAP